MNRNGMCVVRCSRKLKKFVCLFLVSVVMFVCEVVLFKLSVFLCVMDV